MTRERIRVLLLLPSLHGGGAERMALHLLQHFDRETFDVRMGLLRRSGEYLDQADPSLIDSSKIGEQFLDFDQGDSEAYRLPSLVAGGVLAPVNVVAMMRRFRPHVIVSFRKGMSVICMLATQLYGRRNVKWIAREGNNTLAVVDNELKSTASRRAVAELTRRCYLSADCLLTISHEMGEGLKRDLRLPDDSSHVRTVHNAVDIDTVRRKASEPVELVTKRPYFVAVGRLERQKGFDALLRAYAACRSRDTRDLVILGEGGARAELEGLIQSLGLSSSVHLAGFASNPWAHMARADAFVLSSRWEGFAMVVAESLALGLPSVVTDCDFGPKEIIRNGESGLVIPTDDIDAMASAMDRVIEDKLLRERFRKNGLARSEDFRVERIVRKYEDLFRDVVARK